jgi:PAS domain S-box-containing protein
MKDNSLVMTTDILIVEDSATQAARIKFLLESHGYTVEVAQNGQEAINWLAEHLTLLVISDIVMPEMNGYELCEMIKSNRRTEGIPVILLTSLSDPQEVIEGLSCGADSFITKPYNEKNLLSDIEKVLEDKSVPEAGNDNQGIEIQFNGQLRKIRTGPRKVVKLLLNIYQGAIYKNNELINTQEELRSLNERLEQLVEERTVSLSAEVQISKKITGELKESEERFRSAMENSADAIFICNTEGKYLYTNKAVSDMLGYSSEEMADKTILDISAKNKANEHLEIFRQILENGKVFTEIELLKKDGTSLIADLNSVLMPGGLVYGSCRDITKRKISEEALKHAKEKAEASDKLKTTFLNNISHEIRTPLNGILGFAEVFLLPDLSAESKGEYVSMLFESSDRLINTITNYMDISLITSGNLTVNTVEFCPDSVLENMFEIYNRKTAKKNLKLFLNLPVGTESQVIISDPEIFQKIVSHLLDNAVKFTEKGTISYGYTINEEELEFYVKDTGPGIGKDSLEIIFNYFIKEDRGLSVLIEGSGLGLAIAKGMTVTLGGNMRVESESPGGSCFFFTIPTKTKIK